jgi:E3 ubiquitin-protein ligase HUWE1
VAFCQFGINRIVALKEGGETVPVTQENKREFVQLSAQYRLYSSIEKQIESLLAGFYEIIPKDLITIVSFDVCWSSALMISPFR